MCDARIVLFDISPNALKEILDNLENLSGKVLMDATNSLRVRAGSLQVLPKRFEHGPKAWVWRSASTARGST